MGKIKNKIKKLSNEILLTAIEQSPTSIVVADLEGNIVYVNPKFEELTGYSIDEVLGENPRILKTDYHDKKFYENLWNTITSGKVWNGEFLNKKKSGELFWEFCTIAPVKNINNEIINYIAIKEDITEKKIKDLELQKRNERLEKDLKLAKTIQKSLLDIQFKEFTGIEIKYLYRPYDQIGGDYYYINNCDDNIIVFIADITGHGVPAALFSSVLHYLVKDLVYQKIIEPEDFIYKLNNELFNILSGNYITAIYMMIRPELSGNFNVKYVRCGHPYPVYLSNGEAKLLKSPGTILGIKQNMLMDIEQFSLKKGERIYLYTDGLVELSENNMKNINFEMLIDEIINASDFSLEESVNIIINNIVNQYKNVIDDDIAIIGIEHK